MTAGQHPRWSVRRITNDSLRRYTGFRWSLDHLAPGAILPMPDAVFVAKADADAEAVRRNELAAQGIEVRTIARDNVMGVDVTDALGNVEWISADEWYGRVKALMYRLEERIGSNWKPLPHAYSLDVARHLAQRAATGCPTRSIHRRRNYAVRVVELATGTTVATYTPEPTGTPAPTPLDNSSP